MREKRKKIQARDKQRKEKGQKRKTLVNTRYCVDIRKISLHSMWREKERHK